MQTKNNATDCESIEESCIALVRRSGGWDICFLSHCAPHRRTRCSAQGTNPLQPDIDLRCHPQVLTKICMTSMKYVISMAAFHDYFLLDKMHTPEEVHLYPHAL
jgi:hypothetical protein